MDETMRDIPIKIMIVDDNKDYILLFKHILEIHFGTDIIVNSFTNAEDAIKNFKTEKDYVTILLDVKMPGTSGIDLLKKLESDNIPILMITGSNPPLENINEAFEHGAYDFIIKPNNEEEVTVLINKIRVFLNVYRDKKKIENELDSVKRLSKSELELEIAARRVAEEELFKEKDMADQYLQIAGTMLIALDSNGMVRLANKKTYEILKYLNGELIGIDWFNTIIPKESRLDVKDTFHKIMEGKIELVKHYENPVVTKDGEIRFINWYNTVIIQDDEIIGTLSSGEDITEKKEAEFKLVQAHLELEEAVEILRVGHTLSSKIMKQGLDISVDELLEEIGVDLSLNKAFLYKFTTTIEKFGEWTSIPLCSAKLKIESEDDIVSLMNWVYKDEYKCGFIGKMPQYIGTMFPQCHKQECEKCHAVIFPIIIDKKPWGVMGFTKIVNSSCSDATIKALKILSSIISIVIKQQEENKTLLKMIDERMKIFKTKVKGENGRG